MQKLVGKEKESFTEFTQQFNFININYPMTYQYNKYADPVLQVKLQK